MMSCTLSNVFLSVFLTVVAGLLQVSPSDLSAALTSDVQYIKGTSVTADTWEKVQVEKVHVLMPSKSKWANIVSVSPSDMLFMLFWGITWVQEICTSVHSVFVSYKKNMQNENKNKQREKEKTWGSSKLRRKEKDNIQKVIIIKIIIMVNQLIVFYPSYVIWQTCFVCVHMFFSQIKIIVIMTISIMLIIEQQY